MARMFLIIDGYNLMHAADLGRRSGGPGELEQRRRRLVQQVASRLDEEASSDAVVVFDAVPGSHDQPSPEELSAPLRICFSQAGRDADSEIELMLESHSSPRQVLVISSDHRLHKAARRRRAKCMDSEKFWELLESDDHSSGFHRKKGSQTKPVNSAGRKMDQALNRDEDDIAKDFLNIDISEITRSVRREDR